MTKKPNPIANKLVHDMTAFTLCWGLTTTLLRKGIITKEELITSLRLAKPTPAINELIEFLEASKIRPGGN